MIMYDQYHKISHQKLNPIEHKSAGTQSLRGPSIHIAFAGTILLCGLRSKLSGAVQRVVDRTSERGPNCVLGNHSIPVGTKIE